MIRVIAQWALWSSAWSLESPAGTTSSDVLPAAASCPELPPDPPFLGAHSLFLLPASPAVAFQLWQEGRVSRETEGGSAAKW